MSILEKKKNIWKEAEIGNCDILRSRFIDSIHRKKDGYTPLHILAELGKTEVLNHISIDKVLNDKGETPLHLISDINLVDVYVPGETHREWFFSDGTLFHYINMCPLGGTSNTLSMGFWKPCTYDRGSLVSSDYLQKKYPWYDLRGREASRDIIDEILNYSNAEKFIGF